MSTPRSRPSFHGPVRPEVSSHFVGVKDEYRGVDPERVEALDGILSTAILEIKGLMKGKPAQGDRLKLIAAQARRIEFHAKAFVDEVEAAK